MHYRAYDRMGQIETKGGMTLAILREGQDVTVAVAECSRKDNFFRKQGRIKAEGRLKSANAIKLVLPEETKLKSYVHNQEFVRKKVHKLLAGGRTKK